MIRQELTPEERKKFIQDLKDSIARLQDVLRMVEASPDEPVTIMLGAGGSTAVGLDTQSVGLQAPDPTIVIQSNVC